MDHALLILFWRDMLCFNVGRSVRVIATDALPEDSRITRPMIIVHIVDSSTGRYLARTPPPKVLSLHAIHDDKLINGILLSNRGNP